MKKRQRNLVVVVLVITALSLVLWGCAKRETPVLPTAPPPSPATQASPTTAPVPTLSDQANKNVFHEYFSELGLGKLPEGEKVGPSNFQRNVEVFTSEHQIVLYGTLLQDTQAGQVSAGIYNPEDNRFVIEKSGFPRPMSKGGFASASPVNLPAGKYEYRVYVSDVLVAVFPFEIAAGAAASPPPAQTAGPTPPEAVQSDNKYFELMMETDHFRIYFHSQDKEYAGKLVMAAEDVVPLLTRVYGGIPTSKTLTYLFSTFEEAKQLSSVPPVVSSESTFGGFDTFAPLGDGVKLYIPGKDKILSPRTEPGMKNMMAHEVGHRFFYHLYPNIRKPVRPNWLDEGLATYAGMEASGWGATGYGFNAIVEAVKTSKPLWTALANLDRLQESAESLELFYGTAATVIYHICTSYSEQALKQLLTEYNGSADLPQAIQKTLGISYAEFEEKWASLVQDIARHANDGTQFYELLQKSKA